MSRGDCPFCLPEAERVFHEGPLTRGLWDGFAVSAGHALLVPKRHVSSWFEASEAEQHDLADASGYDDSSVVRCCRLSQNTFHDVPMHVGQAVASALKFERQAFVVDSQQVQNRRL